MYIINIPLGMMLDNISEDSKLYFPLITDFKISTKILFYSGIIASVSFILGSLINGNYKKEHNKISLSKNSISNDIKKIRAFSYILISAGTLLFFYGIYKQGGLSYIFSKYVWNDDNSYEVGLMTTGIQLAFCGLSISFYNFLMENKNKLNILKWKEGYVLILLVVIKLLQGGRIQVMMGLLTIVLIYHYSYKKFSTIKIVLVLIVSFFAMGFFGYFRDYKTIDLNNLDMMYKYIFGQSGNLEYFLNSYTIYTTTYLIGVTSVKYLFGSTYLDVIFYLIPRVIFDRKDEFVTIFKFTNDYSSIINLSPVGGFNLASQNLINGNIISIIISMFFLGLLFSKVDNYKRNSKLGILLYSLITPILTISFIRNPMVFAEKELIQFALIPFLVVWVINKRR
jgi:oligosaccharide repeat unit polymerase